MGKTVFFHGHKDSLSLIILRFCHDFIHGMGLSECDTLSPAILRVPSGINPCLHVWKIALDE